MIDCRAILFDLDGVLVDSAECIARIWRGWAAGHHLEADHVVRTAQGRRTIETLRLVAPHLDTEVELAALADVESRESDGVREMPGAPELVRRLPEGSWAVVTSGLRSVAEPRLRIAGLPRPAVLICADDVVVGKPDPEGYLEAARRLGVAAADCLVIEDAPAGIEAARAGGMQSLAVASTHDPSDLGRADVIVPGLSAITIDVVGGRLRVTASGGAPPSPGADRA